MSIACRVCVRYISGLHRIYLTICAAVAVCICALCNVGLPAALATPLAGVRCRPTPSHSLYIRFTSALYRLYAGSVSESMSQSGVSTTDLALFCAGVRAFAFFFVFGVRRCWRIFATPLTGVDGVPAAAAHAVHAGQAARLALVQPRIEARRIIGIPEAHRMPTLYRLHICRSMSVLCRRYAGVIFALYRRYFVDYVGSILALDRLRHGLMPTLYRHNRGFTNARQARGSAPHVDRST